MDDPFTTLRLTQDALPSEIRAAHRLGIAEVHRTTAPSSAAWSERMAALNVARDAALAIALKAPCRDCGGSGRAGAFACEACRGTGRGEWK